MADQPQRDPAAQYRITLNKVARHGSSILRPKDSHVLTGEALDQVEPQDAIASEEKV